MEEEAEEAVKNQPILAKTKNKRKFSNKGTSTDGIEDTIRRVSWLIDSTVSLKEGEQAEWFQAPATEIQKLMEETAHTFLYILPKLITIAILIPCFVAVLALCLLEYSSLSIVPVAIFPVLAFVANDLRRITVRKSLSSIKEAIHKYKTDRTTRLVRLSLVDCSFRSWYLKGGQNGPFCELELIERTRHATERLEIEDYRHKLADLSSS